MWYHLHKQKEGGFSVAESENKALDTAAAASKAEPAVQNAADTDSASRPAKQTRKRSSSSKNTRSKKNGRGNGRSGTRRRKSSHAAGTSTQTKRSEKNGEKIEKAADAAVSVDEENVPAPKAEEEAVPAAEAGEEAVEDETEKTEAAGAAEASVISGEEEEEKASAAAETFEKKEEDNTGSSAVLLSSEKEEEPAEISSASTGEESPDKIVENQEGKAEEQSSEKNRDAGSFPIEPEEKIEESEKSEEVLSPAESKGREEKDTAAPDKEDFPIPDIEIPEKDMAASTTGAGAASTEAPASLTGKLQRRFSPHRFIVSVFEFFLDPVTRMQKQAAVPEHLTSSYAMVRIIFKYGLIGLALAWSSSRMLNSQSFGFARMTFSEGAWLACRILIFGCITEIILSMIRNLFAGCRPFGRQLNRLLDVSAEGAPFLTLCYGISLLVLPYQPLLSQAGLTASMAASVYLHASAYQYADHVGRRRALYVSILAGGLSLLMAMMWIQYFGADLIRIIRSFVSF
jgi:hypothetical protein